MKVCGCCGRSKKDERKDPGPCWRKSRHNWIEWKGKTYFVRSSAASKGDAGREN